MSIRIGIGFDSQIFSDNTSFILGGLKIPFKRGLNSDVLISAICAAMFGALAMGSIKDQFPDRIEILQNTHSRELLMKSYDLIRQERL
jgi:2-C-methyl-D-erythritol 2,4-cyclodiphosphate synthase